jgi:hypoxanthine phosphoribosyltransferase
MKKLDWNEYHGYIDRLANHIIELSDKKEVPYRHLFGADSDALIIAVHLSHKLHIPLVTDISLLVYLYNMGTSEDDTLLVSNIVRTGKTFQSIIEQCKSPLDTAVLFKESSSKFIPTYYIDIPDKKIIFPWEEELGV